MMRNFGFFAFALVTLAFVGYACTSGEVVDGPATGTGTGNTTGQGTGNTTGQGTGNTTGQAGTMGTGNTTGRGGTTGTGNVTGRGGTTGTGNTAGQAGVSGTGNTAGQAGVSGTGNTAGQAGVSGTGNTTGQAGVSGAAGSTGACPPTFSVSTNGFVQMPAKGACWSGYPYTYQDAFGTMVMPVPMAAWTTSTLKMTGTLAAVSGTNYSYAGMGFSVGQTASGSPALVTPQGSGLTVTFSNSTTGAGGLRAQLTNGTTTWCKDITTSPAVIAYTDLKVACYNGATAGAAYAKEPIKGFELNLPGGTAAGTINLTITSITEN